MAGKSERRLPDLVARVKLQTNDLDFLPKRAAEAGAALRVGLGEGEAAALGLTHKMEGATLELKRVGAGGKNAGKGVAEGAHAAERGLINLEHTAEMVKARLGEVGKQGSELRGMLNLGGGSLVGGLALTAGVGAIGVGLKEATEQAEKHEKAQLELEQAFHVSGLELEAYRGGIESFLKKNEAAIPDVNAAREALAGFIRAGFDYPKTIDAMSVAVNLAAIKHVDLATASKAVLLGMEGNGKALKDLGIDLKELKNSDENSVKAFQDLQKANDEVVKATKNHDAAAQHLADVHKELAGKTTLSTTEQIRLRDAQTKADDAQKELTRATNEQKVAQEASKTSMQLSTQVLRELGDKTEDGASTYTDMEKAQHRANAEWDRAANELGPPLIQVETALVKGAADAYAAMERFGRDDSWWKGLNDGLVNVARTGRDTLDVLNSISSLGANHWGKPVGDFVGGIWQDLQGPNINVGGRGGGRAEGGPVLPHGVYTVGERGRETLIMGERGGVVMPDGGRYAAGAGAPASSQPIEIHQRMDIPIFLDSSQIGYAVQRQVRRELAARRG